MNFPFLQNRKEGVGSNSKSDGQRSNLFCVIRVLLSSFRKQESIKQEPSPMVGSLKNGQIMKADK